LTASVPPTWGYLSSPSTRTKVPAAVSACKRGHNGADDDLQHAEPGVVGDLEEGERTAALLPPGSDLAAADHALAEEVVRARGRASPKSLLTIARPRTRRRRSSRRHIHLSAILVAGRMPFSSAQRHVVE
jgi:hypothetical protein